MTALVEVRGLEKRFGAVHAVRGVDLTVKQGEVYGFLGANGAGKTTTLKMILGLTHPTGGEIRIGGVDARAEPARSRASLGYLPETMSLYKTLTGRETLRFFAELRGATRSEVDERLAEVGLAEAADRRVAGYSKGMMQRLGLAQALLASPRLLVLDEPTSGLDPEAARSVKDLLRSLNAKGVTILFSSHVLSEVEALAHRVGVIRRGRLVAEDSLDALRGRFAMRAGVRVALAFPAPPGVDARARGVPGVDGVTVGERAIEIVCKPEARWRAIKAVEAAGAAIVDVETRDASLEDVFMEIAKGVDA